MAEEQLLEKSLFDPIMRKKGEISIVFTHGASYVGEVTLSYDVGPFDTNLDDVEFVEQLIDMCEKHKERQYRED